jgi:hypothetical protein
MTNTREWVLVTAKFSLYGELHIVNNIKIRPGWVDYIRWKKKGSQKRFLRENPTTQ